MTVIDVSEEKQRQLVAEWKSQQERQEKKLKDQHPRVADDGHQHPRTADDDDDDEEYRDLRNKNLGEVLIGHHAQPTTRLRDVQPASPAVDKPARRRPANDTVRAFHEQKVVQLLNRAAGDGQGQWSTADSVPVDTYDVRTQIPGDFDCVQLAMKPSPSVCLYPNAVDAFISKNIRDTGLWEPHIMPRFQNVLYGNVDFGVIDIGANIGVYSLVSAAMGRDVIAVEPDEGNLRRLHKGVNIGMLSEVRSPLGGKLSVMKYFVCFEVCCSL